jgi:hypothetical protein
MMKRQGCLPLRRFPDRFQPDGYAAGAFRALLTNREQWEALVADRSLIPNAVEESLRFYTPVPHWRRITTKAALVEHEHQWAMDFWDSVNDLGYKRDPKFARYIADRTND